MSKPRASHVRQIPGAAIAAPERRRPRVAFYSHDTMGMGHLRRNLLIAAAMTRSSVSAEALIISGASETAWFSQQAGMDCVTLPALHKDICGQYKSRSFDWSLERILAFRSRIIAATIECFQPDVFVVDKVPRGIGNELDAALNSLRQNSDTHCVLGLRDVLDDPQTVQREWKASSNDEAIARYFDEVWIYGDPVVYDSISEYGFSSEIADKTHYTGYLDQTVRSHRKQTADQHDDQHDKQDNRQPLALCVVGGGQDGFALASAFIQDGVPDGWRGVVITGPCMPAGERRQLNSLAEGHPEIQVIDQLVETDDWLARATRVVAMGGYNTVTAILSFGKPALIVPRIEPRQEQWIRAERLQSLGWTSVVSPADLKPGVIRAWLENDQVPVPDKSQINLDGLLKICGRLESVVQMNGDCDAGM
jgi:predicted glycosyltransferase